MSNRVIPLNEKHVRANQASFVDMELNMGRPQLGNKLKFKSKWDRKAYNKQRNMCVKLLKKTQKELFVKPE